MVKGRRMMWNHCQKVREPPSVALQSKIPDDLVEPMFDEEDFLDQEAEAGRDASVTPTASPRRKSNGLSKPIKPITIKATPPTASSAAEAKLMTIVGANLPSHRGSWRQSGVLEEAMPKNSRPEDTPDPEDDEGNPNDSTEGETVEFCWQRMLISLVSSRRLEEPFSGG